MDMKTENKIKKNMGRYTSEQFELYTAEAGWEEWMEEYTFAEDGEELSEEEIKEIERIQKDLWCEVHRVTLK